MEEFRKQLEEFLGGVGFTAGEDEWTFQIPESSHQVQMNINGQNVRGSVPIPSTKLRVAIVGEADVAGEPGFQILFEVSQESNILGEYEEVFYAEDFNRFVYVFQNLFK